MLLTDSFTVTVGAILTLLHVVGQVTAEVKYTVVGPGSIKSHRDYNVAIAVHYTKEPVTVKIGITGPSHNETRTVEFTKSNVFKQLSFELPSLQPGDYDLTGEGVSGLVFKDSVRLIWDSPDPMLFLHIDKFEYKPGDTVNYRVMILDEQLRPNLKAEDIVVCLRDPTDFYIDKARPARTTTGVYTGKFHLSKLASLGEWTIDFEDTDGEPYRSDVYTFTFFNVERYVEPKYLVRIDAPKLVSVKDGVVQIFVLAKYSYGTRVKGKVVVNIELFSDESVKKLTNHTVMVAQDMVKGKATFDINLNQFASWVTKQNSKYLVAINASVEDHLTGKKITETGEFKLVLNRYLVSCVDMHECYTYSKDKEKEVIISITKLDGTLPTDTDSVVKLKYSEGKQDFFGVYNRLSENKNRTFIFDGHLNTSGLVVFKVTLPGFPNKMRFWPYDLTLLYAESWFFTDIERTETAVSKLSHTLPDALGRWVINGFSLHPEKGLCVPPNSKMTVISTSIPYFISVRLPHSMKLGEWIRVPVIVDNYVPQEFDMEVTLDNPDAKFDFADASNQGQNLTQVIRVGANEAAGASFLIRPKVIGNILLKFSAISPLAGDAVHKSLKVIPEGITKYQNRAFFVNLKDVGEYKNTFELEVPEDIVPDSQRVEFGLVGDLLGPVIKNLENLLRLPSGCGEQTMSKLVPNYLVRDYLKSIKKLTPAIETRIKRNLQEGYQNMLHYRHDDGSFSSFGPGKWREEDPDRNGSTWLTSYVLRSFRNIKDIIYLNENLFTSAYKFLLSRQAENGSFTDAGEYFYGSLRSSLTLTANALLALLEQDKKNQTAIDKAVSYLSAHTEESEELLPKSIAVYALQKSKAPDAAKHVASLKALAQQEDDRTWWTEDTEKLRASKGCRRWWCWVWSHDVEITSYALLTLLETEQETPDSVLNTIRWLVAQRNSFGGFASSQDTVVGLQALIKFAEKSGYEAAKWEVSVSNKGKREKTEKLSATEENDLVLQTVEFPQGTQSLEFEAKGTGAALIQISYQYNVVEKETKPSFKIQTIVKPESSPAKLELSVCVEYVEEGKANASNMAILEVSLPSGYTADEDSFKDIKDIERVRLVETKNGDSVIVVYFENLLRGELKCIPFDAFRTHAVANQKPAPVVLYDYYDTNKKATEYYQIVSNLCDICEDSECKAAVSYLK
ncbi:CD109 antigen [Drosophila persimilis]|uniref:CD109 antigen n=1 Tax=Drosophila persimilis TaxID=7234 RepID=UPI000F08D5D4|nr:CD109 antigen [Drosophila persimilis]